MTPKGGGMKNPFSSGLGKSGRLAAWMFAIGSVAAWNFYENRDNGASFSKREQEEWNKKTKDSKASQ